MAISQEYTNEMISQIATVAAAAVHAILAERVNGNGDDLTRCRSVDTGVRLRLGRPSLLHISSNKVKSIYMYHTYIVDKAETSQNVRNPLDRQALIQAEQEEDNESELRSSLSRTLVISTYKEK